ncbi:MAG TPA: RHS repeat-associated core domain-containing protein [Pyrinomonadaceae bacterium]|nr:RHS repeat-associated core domain-containing protein [Pyrinomonadaceae bacterium]
MKRLTVRRISADVFKLGCVCLAIFCFANASRTVKAQSAEFTQNTPQSHDVTLDVPLVNYAGRGGGLPVRLTYSTAGLWRIGFINSVPFGTSIRRSVSEAIYAEHSTAGWTTSMDIPKVEWPRQNDVYWYTGKTYTQGTLSPFTYRVAQLFMHMPDGSVHEMRKTSDAVYQDNGSINMVGIFYSVDGSRMRYDSNGQNSGTLYLPDGTRYIIGAPTSQYIDRNGNTLNFDHSTRKWTDTMGRELNMPWPANPGPGDYTYSLLGVNGSTNVYTIKFRSLSAALTPDAQGGTPALRVLASHYLSFPDQNPTGTGGTNFPQPNSSGALFFSTYSDPEETSSSFTYVVGRGQQAFATFNPTVLTEIVLPTGQSYKFSYNVYGELDKVIYPAGGYQRYQYDMVPSVSFMTDPYTEGNRGMISRSLSPNGTGGADESKWEYSKSFSPMIVTAPDKTRTEVYLFYPLTNFDNQFGYRDSRQGLLAEQRVYAPELQGGAMLRRTLYQYGQTSSVTAKPTPNGISNPGTYTAYRNPRIEKRVDIILDTGGDALAKTTIYGYIDNTFQFSTGLDLNSVTETNFQSVPETTAKEGAITDILAGTTASKVETTYLNTATYRNRNILGLATSVVVKGIVQGTLQTVARTDYSYDELAYPLLTYGDLTGADYTNPLTDVRGNVTTTKRFVTLTPGAEVFLQTHAQFDQCGNLRKSWDERGNLSETEYSSDYKHAYATQTTTAIPDPGGTHGSNSAFVSTSTFDASTGLLLTKTDHNGQTTSYSYQDDQTNYDSLNRLRKVTRPDGSWTKFTYNDVVGNLFILTEKAQDAERTTKMYEYVDPMARPSRTFVSENASSYIVTDTLYDQMGRVSMVSNPYRTTILNGVAQQSNTDYWITSEYDPLGRTTITTAQDGSKVHTDYNGVYTTVTDQTGKQRRQKLDALGRIIRVDEPDSSGSLGTFDAPTQPTSYEYDTQGNLVHVIQGSSPIQERYFKYDPLNRLTYEHQVEQVAAFTASDPVTGHSSWSRKLVYDETFDTVTYSGLLTTVSDARNVQTKFRYDNLNRTYQINYSDDTPAITNKYDQFRQNYLNKGHLTEALTAAAGSIPATGQRYNFDSMGRIASSEQTVDAQTFTMSYGYNLAGALTSETYPSGRVVNYAYDEGARLLEVSSGTTMYASQLDYTSSTGQLKSLSLGNSAVESYVYNSRMQLQSLDLTKDGNQLQHYDYKFGVYNSATNTVDESKNNGQLAQVESFVGLQKKWQQDFAYDSVGRLSSAREFRGDNGQQSYLVQYDYDVFGNRYQKQSRNANNPFVQVWVEDNEIDKATNRLSTGAIYDNAGNVTTDSKFRNRKFQYDANNRQKRSTNLNDTNPVDSIFDAGGQRVATQIGVSLTSVLVYDAMGKLVAEYNSATVSGGTQYILNDAQGSPRLLSNPQGVVVARHDYLPFGEDVLNAVGMRTSVSGYGGTDALRQKFAGMETNEATGMAHTLWRQYDSLSARWTAPDPYNGSIERSSPQTLNRYTYVNNDPVNKVDPSGLMLSDIGVYQTSNPEVAAKIERAIEQGIKNWVAQRQTSTNIRTATSMAWLGRAINAGVDRRTGHSNSNVTVTAQVTRRILIIVGDAGLLDHSVGRNFERVAETKRTELEAQGFSVVIQRASTIEDFNFALIDNGLLSGVEYIGHASWNQLFVGERPGRETNLMISDVPSLSGAKLAPDAYIKLNACYAGSGGLDSIAGAMATHFRLPVFAFDGGTLFYGSPNPVRGSGGTRPPDTGPLYLLEDRGTRFVQIRP